MHCEEERRVKKVSRQVYTIIHLKRDKVILLMWVSLEDSSGTKCPVEYNRPFHSAFPCLAVAPCSM